MGNHIYVGNLGHRVSEEAVADVFRPFGQVLRVLFPLGRDTGAPRGFAFVTMSSAVEAAAALAAIGAVVLDGRSVTLRAAQDWPSSRPITPGHPR